MVSLIYGIIIIFSTFLGAFVGLGGGVIIKPLLDLIGRDTVDVVNFISTCAVFSMSISSSIKHIRNKTKIDFRFVITLSIGAVIGGILGSGTFNLLIERFDLELLKGIQGLILGLLLVASVIYINLKNKKSFDIKSPVGIALVGLTLGFIASFLGVGGGPINVAFLVLFFSMSMKESAVYSVIIIFFSQLSKLISMGVSQSVPQVSIVTLAVAIVCAVLGGILGAWANNRSSEKTVKVIFTVIISALSLVNFYNATVGIVNYIS